MKGFVIVLLFTLFAIPEAVIAAESDPGAIVQELSGTVVCARPTGIYRSVIGESVLQQLSDKGSYPRFSPDGATVAYVTEHAVVQVAAAGGEPKVLADVKHPRAFAFEPTGRFMFFTDAKETKSVDLRSGKVQVVLDGLALRELDAAPQGNYLIGTSKRLPGFGYAVAVYDLRTRRESFSEHGCGGSFSPDGTRITVLGGDHKQVILYDWQKDLAVGHVDAPKNLTFDNPSWSNHENYLVTNSEGKSTDIYVQNIKLNRSYQVTFSGDCERGDLFVSKVR